MTVLWKVTLECDGPDQEVLYNSRGLREIPQLFVDGTVKRVTIERAEGAKHPVLMSSFLRSLLEE